jgi:hypothetical protein
MISDSVLHDNRVQVMYGAKGRCFLHGKRRILIVSFLDCTQVSSRKEHGKASTNIGFRMPPRGSAIKSRRSERKKATHQKKAAFNLVT